MATLLLIVDLFDFFSNNVVSYICYSALGICTAILFYTGKSCGKERKENK
ncbi:MULTISPECIES: hypothetical protein [Myroides]|nr:MULTISPECIES: hypothetical protein [Myroides]MCS7472679.1 hypothetical protein [Myroides odoratimimus]MDM1034154.1 hypothetical protein [Myroides odoratimimus]MDM1037459.1 hypothetical protein [Myroides odoratimimus]MDM1051463.1 hypothetical protein [Myroides odoratimimus]MDM1064237.1 hypothetical protein [Myroides odoratimimus]